MNLKPLGDNVVLQLKQAEERIEGGLYMPDNAKEKPLEATVIAVGSGQIIDGKLVPIDVKAGDTVIYNKFSGTEVKIDNQEYLVVRANDILAKVE